MTPDTDDLRGKVNRLRELGAKVSARLAQSDDLEDFAEHFVYPLFATDERANITWCNSTWCEAFGYSKDEALGMNIVALVDEHDRCTACEFFEPGGATQRHPRVLHFIHKNGRGGTYLTAVNSRVSDNGRVVGLRCILIRKELLNGAAEQLLRAGDHGAS